MQENMRRFSAGPDPFGRTWEVEFRWLQTAISIRHADTVDVKYQLWVPEGPSIDAEPKQEKVLALPHQALLDLSKERDHALTDSWCMKLAGNHLRYMIESGEDLDKTLITLSTGDLTRASRVLSVA